VLWLERSTSEAAEALGTFEVAEALGTFEVEEAGEEFGTSRRR